MTDEHVMLPFDHQGRRHVRRQWHRGRWFYAVVDVIGMVCGAQIPRNYWADLRYRLLQDDTSDALHAPIVQLKMLAFNGKRRETTDATDVETLLGIVQSLQAPTADLVRQWLTEVGDQP